MLASSTIIKDPVNRKKTKQTRELEIIKRLLKAENPLTEEEREASKLIKVIILYKIKKIYLFFFKSESFYRICSVISSEITFDIRIQ